MNSRGYTKDNIHKGNTKIIAGGIDVDGLVRIGDQSVGGDGYVLPSIKGNEGDILTMNADNTTSFKSSSLASARVVQNLFQMEIPTYYYANSGAAPEYVRMYLTNTGSDIIDTSQIAVGGVIRMRTKGYVYNDINNAGSNPISFGQFRIFIGIDNAYGDFFCDSSQSLPVIDSAGMGVNPSFGRGWWSIEVNIVKLDELNNCYVSIAGLYNGVNTSGTSADTFDLQFYSYDPTQRRWPNASGSTLSPSNFYSPMPSTFQLRLSWRATQGNAYAIATEYTIDYLNIDQGVLATITAPTTDHNSLANLNVGDPHQLYAYLGGRSGGQVLSGGITPANFLTLKSHTAGLPNITIKDLNTQFNKNLDIGTKSIIDGVNNTIDFFNGDMALVNTGVSNSIGIGSQNNIVVGALNQIKLAVPNASNNIIITPTDTSLNQTLNMNNNKLELASEVSSLKYTIIGTDIESPITNIIRLNTIGGIAPTFSPSQLDMNNGSIVSIGNFLTTNGSSNIDLPVVAGVPSGAVQVQQGGVYIKKDLQVDGSIYCGTINGITAVGGLFAGTSDSLNVAATTAEISILPLTFVGVGFGVPPNGFSVGDTFRLELSGPFNSNNNDTLTIRLKGGPTSTTLLSTLVVPLNSSSGSVFQLSVLFQIRAIGGAGVADIISDGDLTYNQSGAGGSFVGEQSLSQNNTTFATDVANVLDVTAQFSSTSANNNMTTRLSKLNKVF